MSVTLLLSGQSACAPFASAPPSYVARGGFACLPVCLLCAGAGRLTSLSDAIQRARPPVLTRSLELAKPTDHIAIWPDNEKLEVENTKRAGNRGEPACARASGQIRSLPCCSSALAPAPTGRAVCDDWLVTLRSSSIDTPHAHGPPRSRSSLHLACCTDSIAALSASRRVSHAQRHPEVSWGGHTRTDGASSPSSCSSRSSVHAFDQLQAVAHSRRSRSRSRLAMSRAFDSSSRPQACTLMLELVFSILSCHKREQRQLQLARLAAAATHDEHDENPNAAGASDQNTAGDATAGVTGPRVAGGQRSVGASGGTVQRASLAPRPPGPAPAVRSWPPTAG